MKIGEPGDIKDDGDLGFLGMFKGTHTFAPITVFVNTRFCFEHCTKIIM